MFRSNKSREDLRVVRENLHASDLGKCLSAIATDIYYHPCFLDYLGRVAGGPCELLVARDRSSIIGVMPFFECKDDDSGVVINSSPWFGSHGGCNLVDARSEKGGEARIALLDAFKCYHSRSGALSSTVILHREEMPFLDDYRSRLQPRIEDQRTGQVTRLPAEATHLMEVFKGKTRNLVRKALAQGFKIKEARCDDERDAHWQVLYEIHAENMGALGAQPKPESHFVAMRECLPADKIRLSVACDESGEVVGALLLLIHGGTVEYLTPVVRVEVRSRQPLSALIYDGMIWAIKRGAVRWNWGGTWKSQKSLHHFKAGFGAHNEVYTYLTLASASAVERIAAVRESLSRRFPFYFVYPYHALDDSTQ